MGYDVTWFKEYDGVYFETWQRVTRRMVSTLYIGHQHFAELSACFIALSCFYTHCTCLWAYQCMTFSLNIMFKSFRDALEEVCSLDMFPFRQPMMKVALEFKETMQMTEEEMGCFGL